MPTEPTPPRLDRSPELMSRGEVALLVIDAQERLLAAQRNAERVVWNCGRLIEGAQAVGVPAIATEQAPDKLGPTAPALAERIDPPHAKTAFSAAACEAVIAALTDAGARHVLLAGVETHVCVAQTALDLLAEGFQPKVAVDAVASRFDLDHQTALRRLEGAGVVLTTTEAALFEWVASADDDAFRRVSALAKQSPPEAAT